jgi:hypothetical protein
MLSLAWIGVSAGSCDDEPRRHDEARPTATPARTPAPAPTKLGGSPLAGSTRLRLLTPGWLTDVDAGTSRPVRVTDWLDVPGRAPVLLDRSGGAPELGVVRIGATRIATELPDRPRVVEAAIPATATFAATADSRGFWVVEYTSRSSCQLRRIAFDGRAGQGRAVACGTRPIVETPHGLWVSRGPDAFVAATQFTSNVDYTFVLLDTATLADELSYPEVRVVDDHHVLTMDDTEKEPVLRDLRSGAAIPLTWPAHSPSPTVGPVSPDGRYALVLFEDPSPSPQVTDVWLLHLHQWVWLHVPSMPAHAELKGSDMTWAPDGRLVLFGRFPGTGDVVATWRPGDTALAVRPQALPAGGVPDLLVQ